MRIIDVDARVLDFGERASVWQNARLSFGRQRATLVEVRTDAGLTGVALTAGRAAFGSPAIITGPLREAVTGEDPLRTELLWDRMVAGWRKPVTKGEVISAVSGVDIALWDLRGKALGMPLHRLLGGYRERVPVYAAGGYYQGEAGTAGLVDELRHYLDSGFTAVKMKVGGQPLAADADRVRAAREAVGPDVALKLDANYAWRAHEALRFLDEVAETRPDWIEEPTAPDDVRGAAHVRRHTTVPVAAGENEFTRFGCHRLLEAEAVDVLQLDACVGGGITEWLKVAALASTYHCDLAPHGDPLVHQHLVAAVPNATVVESYPLMHAYMEPLLGPLRPVDGELELPQAPGLGLDLDWELVEAHTIET